VKIEGKRIEDRRKESQYTTYRYIYTIYEGNKMKRVCLKQAHHQNMRALSAGHGLWLDRGQQSCLILWKKLEAWAATIHEWARSSGMQDSVMTVDELSSGDEVRGTGEPWGTGVSGFQGSCSHARVCSDPV